MAAKSKIQALLTSGSSLRTLKNWIPKTRKERTRERIELERLDQEMAPTLSHVSPDVRDEIRTLAHTGHPLEAEQELIDFVVTEDHSRQRRAADRKGAYRDEGTMHDRLYWFAAVPAVAALYCIFSWLTTGHIRMP